jgi:hypothetical protein
MLVGPLPLPGLICARAQIAPNKKPATTSAQSEKFPSLDVVIIGFFPDVYVALILEQFNSLPSLQSSSVSGA